VITITQNNNTTIYYFSGTGNSLHTAKFLQEKLNDCELLPIASLIKQDSIEDLNDIIVPIDVNFRKYHDTLEQILEQQQKHEYFPRKR